MKQNYIETILGGLTFLIAISFSYLNSWKLTQIKNLKIRIS